MKFLPVPAQADNITGLRFGRLTVLGPTGRQTHPSGKSHLQWLCRCGCGGTATLTATRLKNGHTRSCGCLAREGSAERARLRNTSHGEGHSPEYNVWYKMLDRCQKDERNYKGRGITVCARWQDSVIDFIADVGRRPSPKHSIERINNSGNYEPGNVCWATKEQQMRNMRKTLLVTAFGKTQSLAAFLPNGSKSPVYHQARYRIKSGMDHQQVIAMALLGW